MALPPLPFYGGRRDTRESAHGPSMTHSNRPKERNDTISPHTHTQAGAAAAATWDVPLLLAFPLAFFSFRFWLSYMKNPGVIGMVCHAPQTPFPLSLSLAPPLPRSCPNHRNVHTSTYPPSCYSETCTTPPSSPLPRNPTRTQTHHPHFRHSMPSGAVRSFS
jgi:hypothetical protein